MESGQSGSDDTFRVPEQPAPVSSHGGRRRGAGRKKVHEGGYTAVRDLQWKTVAMHSNVFEEWVRHRDRLEFKNNTDFAQYLLSNLNEDNSDQRQEAERSNTSENLDSPV